MYYILFPVFYLLSLLPFRLLYLLSDLAFLIIYYVVRYRREVVKKNLKIAFPEKTDAERLKIEKEFYQLFTDSFIEMIKLISISKKSFEKRMTGNFEELNQYYHTHNRVQLHSGHFFNWEYINLALGHYSQYPFLGVYKPIANKAFDRIIYNMRKRFGTHLISAYDFSSQFIKLSKGKYAIGIVADQSTLKLEKAFWYPFFGVAAPFVTGPEKGAKKNNTVVIMVSFEKVKRGYYRAHLETMTTTPRETPDGYISKHMIRFIEEAIKKNPANYLWTHKRWKRDYKPEYGPLHDRI